MYILCIIYYIYIYIYIPGPIRQTGWMIWVGGALIRQALANSMIHAQARPIRHQCDNKIGKRLPGYAIDGCYGRRAYG